MSDEDALLRFETVRKDFGKVGVLRDVSFTVGPNEFLTLLGPSGSGKTTILRLIAGFETPTTGRIWSQGRDIASVPINRRPFNTVFQDYALFPHMSVRRNVGYGLMVRRIGAAEIRQRVDEVLRVVDLAPLADRLPSQLSGGQRQRVALARAIVCRPRLILLDEPLAALDIALRATMCKFLKDIQRRLDIAFVYVTHDQSEAITLSDRIIVLRAGAIEQIGTPVMLYRRPKTTFVAAFFGENNLLPGRISKVEDGVAHVDTILGPIAVVLVTGASSAVAGASATVAIRSEQFQLAPPGPGTPALIVRDVQFAGPTVAIDAEAEGDPSVSLRIRIADARAAPRIGDRVRPTWLPDAPVLVMHEVAADG